VPLADSKVLHSKKISLGNLRKSLIVPPENKNENLKARKFSEVNNILPDPRKEFSSYISRKVFLDFRIDFCKCVFNSTENSCEACDSSNACSISNTEENIN